MSQQIAQTILNQMGGTGKLTAMVGANNFVFDGEKQNVSFKFKACKKCNYVRITLNAMDFYDVEFIKIHREASLKQLLAGKTTKEPTTVETFDNVDCEQLNPIFESVTGLYLSL